VAAVATDAAAWQRDDARGQRRGNNCINRVSARGQYFNAGLVGMRIADHDATSRSRFCTKGTRRGKFGDRAA